jgi:hypothetical protein
MSCLLFHLLPRKSDRAYGMVADAIAPFDGCQGLPKYAPVVTIGSTKYASVDYSAQLFVNFSRILHRKASASVRRERCR